MASGSPQYCRYGNVIYPKLPIYKSLINGYLREYDDTILRLNKYLEVLEISSSLDFSKGDFLGKRLDTFIAFPDDARDFRFNVANVRIFGGQKYMKVPLRYQKTVATHCFRIERSGATEVMIRAKLLLPIDKFKGK